MTVATVNSASSRRSNLRIFYAAGVTKLYDIQAIEISATLLVLGKLNTQVLETTKRKTRLPIARQIIDEISSRKGQFLRKVTEIEAKELGVPEGVDAWTIAEDAVTLEKTKQLLREKEAGVTTSSSQDAETYTRVNAESESATRVTSSQGQQYSSSAASSQQSGTGLLGLLQNAAIGTSVQRSQHLESMLMDIKQAQEQRHLIASILSAQRIAPQQFPINNLGLFASFPTTTAKSHTFTTKGS